MLYRYSIFKCLLSLIILFLVVGCGGDHFRRQSGTTTQSASLISKEMVIRVDSIHGEDSSQQVLIAVCTKGPGTGELYGKELVNGSWIMTYDTVPCSFGLAGVAPFDTKKEGDFKTPSGIYHVGPAFGYSNDLKTRMKFIVLQDSFYWICDTSSQAYNTLVESVPKDGCAEKMLRKDHLYKYGIIIQYNTKPIVKGKGSAIFIHVERSPGSPTAGCIAMSEQNIKSLLSWIRPELNPTIAIKSVQE